MDTFWYSLKEVFFQSDKFENKILSELVSISKGNMITNSTKKDGNIPVIAGGKTHAYYNNKSNYNGNIITISASGAYSGYVWYHDYPIWASDCNVLQSNNKDINIKYIYIILKLNQNNIYKLQKGTAQPHVYASDIENIPIPIPTIEIQNKIADEAMNRREKAFKLQEEAKKIIGEAKKEVETMIFK
ncbi:restriction endonuclease subunit S [Brachyspira hyodysenteriae]|nr:restriction endonuclease subunit S [Brachyspira hyodysenteriae]